MKRDDDDVAAKPASAMVQNSASGLSEHLLSAPGTFLSQVYGKPDA